MIQLENLRHKYEEGHVENLANVRSRTAILRKSTKITMLKKVRSEVGLESSFLIPKF